MSTGHRFPPSRGGAWRGGALLGSLATLTLACSSGNLPAGDTADPSGVATIAMTAPALPLLAGATATLVAVPRDASGAAVEDVSVAWSTDRETVARISPTGVLTAIAPGTATITARAGSRMASVTISVGSDPLGALTVSTARNPQMTGARDTLILTAHDIAGRAVTPPTVTWQSSRPEVATVSTAGVVTALTTGTTVISARAGAVTGVLTLAVGIGRLTLVQPGDPIAIGESRALSLSGHTAGGVPTPIVGATWQSSHPQVASVSETSEVIGTGPGTATITARLGSLQASAVVTVLPGPQGIRLEGPPGPLAPGESFSIGTTLLDASGAPMTWAPMHWTSSNPDVVTVVDGTVTASAPGTATIRLRAGAASDSLPVTVDASITTVVLPLGEFGDTIRIAMGQHLQLWGYALYAHGQQQPPPAPFTWSSSDPAVAIVDGNGLVTATGAGTATISAIAHGATGTRRIRVAETPGTVSVRLVNANRAFSSLTLRINSGSATPLSVGESIVSTLPAGTIQVAADGFVPVILGLTTLDWSRVQQFTGFLPTGTRATFVAFGGGGYENYFGPVSVAALWDRTDPVPPDSALVRVVISASGGTYGGGYNVYLTEPDAPMSVMTLQACYLDWPFGYTDYVGRTPGAFDIVLQGGKFGTNGPEVARFQVNAAAGHATTFIVTGTTPANLQVLALTDR